MGSSSSVQADYSAPAYTSFIVFIVITTLAVTARAASRKIKKAHLWFDDALVYTAWVLNTASLIACLCSTTHGSFDLEKLATFTPAQAAKFRTLDRTAAVLYILTITCSKLSVLFLFRRIFGVKKRWFKVSWWFNALLIFPCWTVLTLAFFIWAQTEASSFTGKSTAYGTAVVTLLNAISDILVLVLPIRSVLGLQLSTKRKIEVVCLFALGLIATSVSLSRAVLSFYSVIHGVANWNPAYIGYSFTVLALAETSATILCACIPVTRPFFIKSIQIASQSVSSDIFRPALLKKRTSSPSTSSDGYDVTPLAEKDENAITRTLAVDIYSVLQQQTDSSAVDILSGGVKGSTPSATATVSTRRDPEK